MRGLEHDRSETIRVARERVRADLNKLRGETDLWEAEYILRAPADGVVAFSDFWSDRRKSRRYRKQVFSEMIAHPLAFFGRELRGLFPELAGVLRLVGFVARSVLRGTPAGIGHIFLVLPRILGGAFPRLADFISPFLILLLLLLEFLARFFLQLTLPPGFPFLRARGAAGSDERSGEEEREQLHSGDVRH